jgi:hypothetical protein
MRVVIFGSRDLLDPQDVEDAIWSSGYLITEVVSGCARGVDFNGQQFARRHNLPVMQMPAQWRDADGVYNPSAGMQRNVEMARYADAGIAVWDGVSPGTKHMISVLHRMKKPVFVHIVKIET